ncbi:UvrD-helicase domain-containing protein [Cloacibacterium caeni]|uniref:UvrD-helicase domain-containing protein n=1 Tax=Cloacibacterium caeni TaxID=2004710 RepID=UPI001BCE26E9|nr:UvrD-helicase domain-containing protein [Cloacibacterium caeni]
MKPYIAINASAGSGKTYTLVQRVLMICLENPYQKDAIRYILALTFTNKAANEMKERILSWLKEFTQENYTENDKLLGIQQNFEEQGKKITLDDLHQRSQKVLDYILHNYSTLNIGTIDKFNAKLVRSFSYELGLAQNFNLEIQPEPFLIEAVDQMLNKIGEDEQISEAFLDYVNYSLDQNERVNINKTLLDSAKEFVNDKHYHWLEENKDFDWKAYENTKNNIRTEIRELKENSKKIAQDSLDLIKNNGLEIEDFSQGANGIGGFFKKIIEFTSGKRDFPFPVNEENFLNNAAKGASGKGKNKESEIFGILETLIENRRKIIQNYILGEKKEKILRALLPLKVNKEIQDQLQLIEDENDLVLLSKFNVLINENLRNEPSAFIYEKVGTQFHHYFFDEFQDTSALQWMNFLPLRDHNIATENSSFTLVGDPKQSIYRFRGGNAEIMLDIINKKDFSPIKVEIETLQQNFRSAKNIVKFNNELYHFYGSYLNEEHAKLFGKDAEQSAFSGKEGRVKVHFLENDLKEIYYQDCTEKMQQDLQECINNGFELSDITILCRGNNDIFNFSKLLGNLKVNYKGEETYIKTISEKGLTLELSGTLRALIQFLYWETFPKNRRFLVKMMYELAKSGRITMQDFSVEMKQILDIENKKDIETFIKEKYGVSLKQEDFPHLNLYNFIEYYIHEFSVKDKETDFLLNFLELLYNYTQNAGATLKDFLQFWEEEGKNTSIQASENIDAIQLMTIHKAKGLEFPVVFLPMENAHKDSKIQDWFSLEENTALKSVNIGGFDKKLQTYDDQISEFNKENAYKNFIDRLCLQYVATTRPVEQLFLYVQKPTTDKNGNENPSNIEIYDFLKSKNVENLDSFDVFKIDENSLKKQSKKEEKQHISQQITSLTQKHEKSANITIATPSKNYQERNEKVRKGIFTHEILAKINDKNDIEKVLKSYLLEGLITKTEKSEIADRIFEIIEKYPKYFTENQEVLSERELMIEGKTYRPDRMVKIDNAWFIIDFKTGNPSENHQKQIDLYQKAMENLGRKIGGAELIYL